MLAYARASANAAKDAAASSRRSAVAARRSADAAERQAAAAEASVPPPPPAVDWQAEWKTGTRWWLRNIGYATATGVTVDAGQASDLVQIDPHDGTVKPGATLSFVTLGHDGSPDVSELWVAWEGQPEPVAVPLR